MNRLVVSAAALAFLAACSAVEKPGDTGPRGLTGPVGSAGPAGAAGPGGASGPTGPDGQAGATGASGASGAPGGMGPTGPTGPEGIAGQQGTPGGTGAPGLTGATGATGALGINWRGPWNLTLLYNPGDAVNEAGTSYLAKLVTAEDPGMSVANGDGQWAVLAAGATPGSTGAVGPLGPQGADGPAGASGTDGIAGGTGALGPTGATGAVGATGPAGPSGTNGTGGAPGNPGGTGVIGATGPVGPFGPIGPTGGIGPTGATGPAGLDTLCSSTGASSWDPITTYAPGCMATENGTSYVAIAGSFGADPSVNPSLWQVLASSASAGAQGVGGAAGGPGATGPTGFAGPLGPVGPAGDSGATGNPGMTGPTGFGGNDGATGDTGAPGPAGPSGVAGSTGGLGATGATGLTGAAGVTGSDGTAGTTGDPGDTGPTGAAGINWRGGWLPDGMYNPGDTVSENGSSYQAVVANTEDDPSTSVDGSWKLLASAGNSPGQAATGAQGGPGATGSTGNMGAAGATGPTGVPGIPFLGSWSSATAYVAGDAVNEAGTSYLALLANTNVDPAGSVQAADGNWAVLAQGQVGAGGAMGAVGATGATGPTGDPGATGAQGIQWLGNWTPREYMPGQGASYLGASYLSLSTNFTGVDPATDVQDGDGNWLLLVASGGTGATGPIGSQGPVGPAGAAGPAGPANPGVAVQQPWDGATSYVVGDIVSESGVSYVAASPSMGDDPSLGSGSWAVLAAFGTTGPVGQDGADGDTGFTGPTGDTGPAGAAGILGSTSWTNGGSYLLTTDLVGVATYVPAGPFQAGSNVPDQTDIAVTSSTLAVTPALTDIGQQFTAGVTGSLTGVQLNAFVGSAITGDVTVVVTEVATSTTLYTQSGYTVDGTSSIAPVLAIDPPVSITAGVQYAFDLQFVSQSISIYVTLTSYYGGQGDVFSGGMTYTGTSLLFQTLVSTNLSPGLVVTSNYNVGINTSSPSVALDVAGDVRADTVAMTSDVRLKKNIEPVTDAMGRLETLQGYSYERIGSGASSRRRIGVIAQDVQSVFPEAVGQNSNGYLAVDYAALSAPLIESIKTLKHEHEALRKRLDRLERER